jgi:hypothetical protein
VIHQGIPGKFWNYYVYSKTLNTDIMWAIHRTKTMWIANIPSILRAYATFLVPLILTKNITFVNNKISWTEV